MVRVADIMRGDVLTAAPDWPVRRLTRLLADHEISGAPVVDEEGRVLGVVSSTDVVRLCADDADIRLRSARLRAERRATTDPEDDEVEPDALGFFLPEDVPEQTAEVLESLPESEFDTTLVSDIMTPVSFSVPAEADVRELADFLVRGRIHRAVVLDGDRLAGIVTSGDVLRAVAEGRLS